MQYNNCETVCVPPRRRRGLDILITIFEFLLSTLRRRHLEKSVPVCGTRCAPVACAPPVVANTGIASSGWGAREHLVATQRIPGERIREVDIVTRKKIPIHEVREIYEGPATVEYINGPEREYVLPENGYVTGAATAVGYGAAATSNYGYAKPPIVHNRKVPLQERILSKVTGKPIITNYH